MPLHGSHMARPFPGSLFGSFHRPKLGGMQNERGKGEVGRGEKDREWRADDGWRVERCVYIRLCYTDDGSVQFTVLYLGYYISYISTCIYPAF